MSKPVFIKLPQFFYDLTDEEIDKFEMLGMDIPPEKVVRGYKYLLLSGESFIKAFNSDGEKLTSLDLGNGSYIQFDIGFTEFMGKISNEVEII